MGFEEGADMLTEMPLLSLHARDETVDALRARFRQLPAGATDLPCPHCFVRGRVSRLETLAFTGWLHCLRCPRCQATVVVETGL
jgi:hypothetical protein